MKNIMAARILSLIILTLFVVGAVYFPTVLLTLIGGGLIAATMVVGVDLDKKEKKEKTDTK